jgi:sigma-B regulation protein RsbU (phosphoserine phosphatase)
MATAAKTFASSQPGQAAPNQVRDLFKLQRAAQNISSILDVDRLLERVVDEVTNIFGCLETSVWLTDRDASELVLASNRGCTVHRKGHRFKVGAEGMVGWAAAHQQLRYAPDVRVDPYYIACEGSTRSEVVIPLRAEGELVGVFSASHGEVNAFSGWQLKLLEGLAEHIAIAVVNARCYTQEQSARLRMSREAEEAREVQRALLPKISPFVPGFSIQGSSLAAGAVGGDWYDFIPLADGRWGIVLADVAGKGMSAALLMSAARAALRSLAQLSTSPGATLESLNTQLLADMPAGRFVTMVYGIFDPATNVFTFANAGHPSPLYANGAAAHEIEVERGLPLGIAQSTYADCQVYFARGSRLALFSDGVLEATDAQGTEYAENRVRALLNVKGICADHVLEDVQQFTGGQVLADDATVILLKAE